MKHEYPFPNKVNDTVNLAQNIFFSGQLPSTVANSLLLFVLIRI